MKKIGTALGGQLFMRANIESFFQNRKGTAGTLLTLFYNVRSLSGKLKYLADFYSNFIS